VPWCTAEGIALDGRPATGFVVLLGLAVGWLAGYVWSRRTAVLAVGVIALATVVPQAVIHYTGGTRQAAGALLVIGLSIIGAGAVGLLVHRGTPAHRAEDR
jgi:hypothetical protein